MACVVIQAQQLDPAPQQAGTMSWRLAPVKGHLLLFTITPRRATMLIELSPDAIFMAGICFVFFCAMLAIVQVSEINKGN